MADTGQRTEQPTQRRREKARREGQFAVSREFVSSVQFAAATAGLVAWAPAAVSGARAMLRDLLSAAFRGDLTPAATMQLLHRGVLPAMWRALAAAALLALVAAALHLGVTRMGFSLKKLEPDFGRLSPGRRLRELPKQNIPMLFQAVVLLPLFGWAVWAVVAENLPGYLRLPLAGVEAATAAVAGSVRDLLWKAAGLLLALGAIDLFRQFRRHARELRMSRQEVRDELKEVEGNPQVKMRIRRIQRDLLRRRMMQEVPRATAVVVNPTHYAVAIRYQVESMAAPLVVAKGRNYLAQRIREIAIDHQVPIVENAPLAQALYKSVEVGQEIPAHLYRAVAEVLAYIYRIMGGRLPGGQG